MICLIRKTENHDTEDGKRLDILDLGCKGVKGE